MDGTTNGSIMLNDGNGDCVLEVDVGERLAPGHAMSLRFRLKSSGALQSPRIECGLSHLLDQTHWIAEPRVIHCGGAVWEFQQNSYLRESANVPCPPGGYNVDVRIEWSHRAAGASQRWYRSTFRIVVPERGDSREMIIEGEGVSIIDLTRFQLDGYDRVRIQARDQAIVSADAPRVTRKFSAQDRYFQLPLTPDFTDALRVHPEAPDGGVGDRIMLRSVTGPQRRWLLFARGTLSLGRVWDPMKPDRIRNDVVVSPIPCEGANKTVWEKISSRHLRLVLSRQGLEIHDTQSANGTTLDGRPIDPSRPQVVNAKSTADAQLELAQAFRLRVRLLAGSPQAGSPQAVAAPGELHGAALGLSGVPPMWSLAQHSTLDAVRLCRDDNLPEEYVLLFRQAVLGPEGGEVPTLGLPFDDGDDAPARVFHDGCRFWLERLSSRVAVRVIDPHHVAGERPGQTDPPGRVGMDWDLPLRELFPLRPGQFVHVGRNQLRVEACWQEGISESRSTSGPAPTGS